MISNILFILCNVNFIALIVLFLIMIGKIYWEIVFVPFKIIFAKILKFFLVYYKILFQIHFNSSYFLFLFALLHLKESATERNESNGCHFIF